MSPARNGRCGICGRFRGSEHQKNILHVLYALEKAFRPAQGERYDDSRAVLLRSIHVYVDIQLAVARISPTRAVRQRKPSLWKAKKKIEGLRSQRVGDDERSISTGVLVYLIPWGQRAGSKTVLMRIEG